MIKNIIFDLGNVLISYRPYDYLTQKGYPEKDIDIIMKDIFKSREWFFLDNGDITLSDAINSIASCSSLSKATISEIFSNLTELLFPITDNANLLPVLKEKGYDLFYLSNFPLEQFYKTKERCPFFKYFTGGIISAEVHLSKPDYRIFNLIFSKYNLSVKDSIFIDDTLLNIDAALTLDLKSFHHDKNSPLEYTLKKAGIL